MRVSPHLADTAVVAVAEEALRGELYRHAAELAAEAREPGLSRLPWSARRPVGWWVPGALWLVIVGGAVLGWWLRR